LALRGLSLVGFLDQTRAINYLRSTRPIAATPLSDTDLIAEWNAAKAKIAAPPPRVGVPDIQPIPAAGAPYITALQGQPWLSAILATPMYSNAAFQWIEIDALLAYQFQVDLDRSEFHCGALTTPPTLGELLNLCLPSNPPSEQYNISVNEYSAVIRARSLNLQVGPKGSLNPPQNTAFGILLNVTLPLVHVTRFNGRCYLHNGYHRVYGAKLAGATHIPAILRDTATAADAGIRADGSTFDLALLESASPPTLAHLTPAVAHEIEMKAVHRVITITWTDHVVPDL